MSYFTYGYIYSTLQYVLYRIATVSPSLYISRAARSAAPRVARAPGAGPAPPNLSGPSSPVPLLVALVFVVSLDKSEKCQTIIIPIFPTMSSQ